MKIGTRDFGLLSAGFILGAAIVGILTLPPKRPGVAPASSGAATAFVLASTLPIPRLATLPPVRLEETSFKLEVGMQSPNHSESWTPGLVVGGNAFDLFSTRHQLQLEDFKMDDAR
jgi:hypothetical protein